MTLLEVGTSDIRHALARVMDQHPAGVTVMCANSHACAVVTKVFQLCSESDIKVLAKQVLQDGLYPLTIAPQAVRVLEAMMHRKSLFRIIREELQEDPGELACCKRGRAIARCCGIWL